MQQYAGYIFAASVGLLLIYIAYSAHKPHPIVNTKLFQIKTYKISSISSFLSRIGFSGVPFLLPLLLQTVLHFNSEVSGALLIPIAVGVLVSKSFGILLLKRMGFKRMLLANTLLLALILPLFALIGPNTSILYIMLCTFLYGFVTSTQFVGINGLTYADLPNEYLSAGTSITATVQQLSQSMGVAISAWCLMGFGQPSACLTIAMFQHTFWFLSLLNLLPIFIFIQLSQTDGKQVLNELY